MNIYHISRESNPYYHLALESALFENPKIESAFLVYCNRETVSIGRFQNPWQETQPRLLRENGIFLSRRFSGGGTVFQDEGNINFSFIGRNGSDMIKKNFSMIQATLAQWGIAATISEKRDMLLQDRKFSGSAFYLKNGKLLHHGTLLVKSDLQRLSEFLKAVYPEIESVGTASRRAKVINLTETAPSLTIEELILALVAQFQKQKPEAILLDEAHLKAEIQKEKIASFSSFRWLLGETPRFQWQGAAFDPRKWQEISDIPEPFRIFL